MKKKIYFIISFLMCLCMTLAMSVSVQAKEANQPADAIYNDDNGHWYQAYTKSITWLAAKHDCAILGGHLVTITDEKEQDFIAKKFGKNKYWTGGYIIDKDSGWKWVTGEKFEYTFWADGQPKNTTQISNDRIMISDSKWSVDSENKSDITGYICEWDDLKDISDDNDFTNAKLSNFFDDGVTVMDGYLDQHFTRSTKKAEKEYIDILKSYDLVSTYSQSGNNYGCYASLWGLPTPEYDNVTIRFFEKKSKTDLSIKNVIISMAFYDYGYPADYGDEDFYKENDRTPKEYLIYKVAKNDDNSSIYSLTEFLEKYGGSELADKFKAMNKQIIAEIFYYLKEKTYDSNAFTTVVRNAQNQTLNLFSEQAKNMLTSASTMQNALQAIYGDSLKAFGSIETAYNITSNIDKVDDLTREEILQSNPFGQLCGILDNISNYILQNFDAQRYLSGVKDQQSLSWSFTSIKDMYDYIKKDNKLIKIEEKDLPHEYGDWEITKNATCTKNGSKERKCINCGKIDTAVISAKGHEWEDHYTVDLEATCVKNGSESIHCKNCSGTKDAKELPATGKHVWDTGYITKKPTCTTDGERTYTCVTCDKTRTEVIPATGHVWDGHYTVDKEATCAEDGSESLHCKNCNATKDSKAIPATGNHIWDMGKVTSNATCSMEGVKTYTCYICGHKKNEAIPKTDHKWVTVKGYPATTTTYGLTDGVMCSECGTWKINQTVIDKLPVDHKFSTDSASSANDSKLKEDTSVSVNNQNKVSSKSDEDSSSVNKLKANKADKTKKLAKPAVKSVKIKKGLKIKINWKKVKKARRYQISYRIKGKQWIIKTTKSNTFTLKKLKNKKTYQIRIRAVDGKTKSKWSKVISLRVK